jgi:hypothetical protein
MEHLQVQTVYNARLNLWEIFLRQTENNSGWITLRTDSDGTVILKQWYEPKPIIRCTGEFFPNLVETLRFITDSLQTRLDYSRPIDVHWKDNDPSNE